MAGAELAGSMDEDSLPEARVTPLRIVSKEQPMNNLEKAIERGEDASQITVEEAG